MSDNIQPIVMPKWGLAMQEGTLTKWYVEEGAEIRPGLEVCDIETSKIANAMEATVSGTLKRRVVGEGTTLPVGALMAVVTSGGVDDSSIDAFIKKFEEEFAAAVKEGDAGAPKAQSVEVNGQPLNYLKLGEGGTPILFLHGFGGDLNNWMFNQPELAAKQATYVLDLPGHGASGKAVSDGSVGAMSDIVIGFMEKVGIDKAHLVGHSMGGAIALTVAQRRPERVASLTLISSAALGPDINIGYIEGFIGASGRRDLKPHLEKLFADSSLVTRDMIDDILKFKRLDGVTPALQSIAGANFPGGRQATILRDQLAGLKMPVQVIFGAEDQIIPAAHAKGLPGNVQVHVLPKAGHMPHMETAGEVNRLISTVAA